MYHYRSWESLAEMIRRVSSARGRRQTGLYAVEGIRLVERAVRAGAPLEHVLVGATLAESSNPRFHDLLAELVTASVGILVAPDTVMLELTEGRDLGAILGLVRLPEPVELDAVMTASGGRVVRLLGAVDIVDPGNIGALMRTAHAGGAAAFLVAGASDPFHPRATRISRGSIFKLPVLTFESANALTTALGAHEVMRAGASVSGGTPLPDVRWPDEPVAILMGNEAEGLDMELQRVLDLAFTIPMAEGIDSYSVNAAAAIALYAATR